MRLHGIWEVAGILAAVIPCGILAGLYLATADTRFIIGCFVLAMLAVAVIYIRSPGLRLRLPRRSGEAGTRQAGFFAKLKASPRLEAAADTMRRTFTRQVLKMIGVVVWFLAWAGTAGLYLRVSDNANVAGLLIYVLIGAFSPVVIYFSLEAGIKKVGRRIRHDDE